MPEGTKSDAGSHPGRWPWLAPGGRRRAALWAGFAAVTKPFSFLELLARVEAVLRRASNGRNGENGLCRYVLGSVTLDFKRLEAHRDGRAVDLTPREFGLLRFFICHEGEVLSRDKLLDALWGYPGSPLTRTVDTHIAKLRKKIEDNLNDPRHIVTVHRVGYRFVD